MQKNKTVHQDYFNFLDIIVVWIGVWWEDQVLLPTKEECVHPKNEFCRP